MNQPIAEASVEVRADTRNFDRELQTGVQRSGDSAGSKLKGVIGKALAGAVAIGGAVALGGLFKSAITGASDLEQSIGAVGTVFGTAGPKVLRFGEGAAKSVGLAKSEYNELAAVVGAQLTRLGQSQDQAAGSTDRLITLGADLAATFGGPTSDAVAAIGSLLRGERDPIERYAVGIKDVDVQARLAATGQDKLKGAALEQAKAQATLSLLFEQTSKVQGAAAREAGTFASQQQQLSANFKNLKETVGGAVLPALTGLVGSLNAGLGPAFAALKERLAPVISAVQANFVPALVAVGEHVKALIPGFLAFAGRIGEVARDLGAQLAPVLQQIGQVISGQVIPAIRAVLPVLAPVAAFFLKVFGGAVIGALQGVVNVVSGVLTTITGVVRAFSALLRGDWSALWTAVKQIVSGVFQALVGAVQVFLNLGVLRAFSLGFAALRGLVTAGFSAVRGIFTGSFSAVEGLTRTVLTNIGGLFTGGFNAVRGVVTGAFGAIRAAVQTGMSAAQGVIGTVLGAVRGLFTAAFNAYVTVVRTVLQTIVGAVQGAMGAVLGAVRAPLSSLGSIFSGAFNAAVGAVRGGIGAVLGLVRGLGGSIRGATSNFGSLLRGAGADLIRGLANGITGAVGQVVDAAKRAAQAAVSAVKGALGINSPSRVFTEIGTQTGAGLALGLDKSRRPVAAAAKDLLDVAGMRAGGTGFINSRLAATGAAVGGVERHTHYHLNAQASEVSIDEQRALELLRRMEDLHA